MCTEEPGGESQQTEHERLLQFMYLLPVGVISAGTDGSVTAMNPFAIQALMPLAASTGFQNLFDVLKQVFPVGLDKLKAFESDAGTICDREVVQVAVESSPTEQRSLEVTLSRQSEGYMAVFLDVSDRVALERELRHQSERLRMVIEFIRGYVIYTLDETGHVDSWNKSGERNLGLSNANALGLPFDEMLTIFCGPNFDAEQVLAQAREHDSHEIEGRSIGPNGGDVWFQKTVTLLTDPDGAFDGYSVIAHNVTEQKQLELRLKHLAETDPLTGAANRRAFTASMKIAVDESSDGDNPVTVAMLDIDHFKALNDTFGHATGDEALKAFVKCITGGLRKGDLLGRLGGEEFGLFLPGVSLETAEPILNRLRERIESLSVPTDNENVTFTVSIGYTVTTPDHCQDSEALLEAADQALYRAKQDGRNRVAI